MLKVLHTGDWHIGSFPGPEVGGQNIAKASCELM